MSLPTHYVLNRVNRQSILRHFDTKKIDKYKELWNPEPGDTVFDGNREYELTAEMIERGIDKSTLLPLINLNKAHRIIEQYGFDFNNIRLTNYDCMEDLVARRMMTAIATKYGV